MRNLRGGPPQGVCVRRRVGGQGTALLRTCAASSGTARLSHPPKMRPWRFLCWGWQVKVFCSSVVVLSTARDEASAGSSRSSRACASARRAKSRASAGTTARTRRADGSAPWASGLAAWAVEGRERLWGSHGKGGGRTWRAAAALGGQLPGALALVRHALPGVPDGLLLGRARVEWRHGRRLARGGVQVHCGRGRAAGAGAAKKVHQDRLSGVPRRNHAPHQS